ncbi:MAG TPA: HlyD family secretion protein [Candidatus Bathyarchaeia archaeon]|nr:HlyD family secretion protein [Candidatus Bathyarchaeia archaeon]
MVDESNEAAGAAAEQKSLRRRKRVLIPATILVVVAAIVFGYWYAYLRGYASTDDAYIDGDAVTVSAKMLGRITLLGAAEGDSVSQGQVLVRLDDSDLKAQEAQAQAGLEYVRQSVPVAKINLDRASDDFDRASYQYRNKVVTKEQFDHAAKALEAARAQYKVASSQVDASKAQLAVIETQLGNTTVTASVAGVVAKKWVVPGDIVQPGQPIFTLYDLGDLWITANFEETKLGALRPGDRVRIKVDALGGREFNGTVVLIGAAAASRFSLIPPNNASGNFTKVTQRIPVKISIENGKPHSSGARALLLPGMSVEVKVREGGK